DVRATAAITVNAPPERVFPTWEGFAALPRFMSEVAAVEVTGERTSRWTATLTGGVELSWEIEITESVSPQRIAWRTSGLLPPRLVTFSLTIRNAARRRP